ncbi:MAG: acetyl-CoA carboxylase carboxyl transferase subunit alpha, partial [Bacteroidota bacterium]
WDYKAQAAEALKLTANDMLGFGIIDEIVKEPQGGAHSQPEEMAKSLKRQLKKAIAALQEKDVDAMIEARIEKYAAMGQVANAS